MGIEPALRGRLQRRQPQQGAGRKAAQQAETMTKWRVWSRN